MLKDHLFFVREFVSRFRETGAVFPTSKWAADALSKPVHRYHKDPLNILEAGPGTGSVTFRLLKFMSQQDTLTICEINPRFMKRLRTKLLDCPDYLRHRDRVHFFTGPVQELPEYQKFDVIVCAIPFLNLDLQTVKQIFDKFERLSTEKTLMTYYEFLGLRSLSMFASAPSRRRRVRELNRYFQELFGRCRPKTTSVWRNLTPIKVYTMNVASNGSC